MLASSVGRLLQDGLRMETFAGAVTVGRRKLGDLELVDGRLAVWDPLFGAKDEGIGVGEAGGAYPAFVSLVRYEDGDERIAGVWVEVGPVEVKAWRSAPAASVYVESGVVCLAGADVAGRVRRDPARERFRNRVEAALEKNYRDTRSWGSVQVESGGAALFCSSGFGDGMYGQYLGSDAEGRLVCVLIDFGLLLSEEEIEAMGDAEL